MPVAPDREDGLPTGSDDWPDAWHLLNESQKKQLVAPHRPGKGKPRNGTQFDWRTGLVVAATNSGVKDGGRSVRVSQPVEHYSPPASKGKGPPVSKGKGSTKKRKTVQSEEQKWQDKEVKHQDKKRIAYLIENNVCAHRCLGINRFAPPPSRALPAHRLRTAACAPPTHRLHTACALPAHRLRTACALSAHHRLLTPAHRRLLTLPVLRTPRQGTLHWRRLPLCSVRER